VSRLLLSQEPRHCKLPLIVALAASKTQGPSQLLNLCGTSHGPKVADPVGFSLHLLWREKRHAYLGLLPNLVPNRTRVCGC